MTRLLLTLGLLLGSAGCTPKQATHTTAARQAAAHHFDCEPTAVRLREEAVGVYLMEGCGEVASFYCAEDSTFSVTCRAVSDPSEISEPTLVDALVAHDKRKTQPRRPAADGAPASVAKTAGDAHKPAGAGDGAAPAQATEQVSAE